MGIAHRKLDNVALDRHAVTDADNFQALGEALGNAFNAVGKKGAAQAVLRTALAGIFYTAKGHMTIGLLVSEQRADRGAQRALGPFNFHNIRSDLDFNAIGNGNGQSTYSRHGAPPTRFRTKVRRPPS